MVLLSYFKLASLISTCLLPSMHLSLCKYHIFIPSSPSPSPLLLSLSQYNASFLIARLSLVHCSSLLFGTAPSTPWIPQNEWKKYRRVRTLKIAFNKSVLNEHNQLVRFYLLKTIFQGQLSCTTHSGNSLTMPDRDRHPHPSFHSTLCTGTFSPEHIIL